MSEKKQTIYFPHGYKVKIATKAGVSRMTLYTYLEKGESAVRGDVAEAIRQAIESTPEVKVFRAEVAAA